LVGTASVGTALARTAIVGRARIGPLLAGLVGSGPSGGRGADNYLVPGIKVVFIYRNLVVVGRRRIGHGKPADRDHVRQRSLPARLAEAGRKHWHHGGLGRETGIKSRLIGARRLEARPG
jgi:hypothetical protein